MDKLTFYEIVACTGGETRYGGADFGVGGVKFDSRENMPGMVFVAFKTEKDDGHKYIPVAAAKGAVAAIVSEDAETGLPCVKVRDTKKAYQDIARYYRGKFDIPVIALTGSNGKTTVKDMLASVLSTKYKVLATEKNLNNELGVPQTLLNLESRHEAAIVEMGMNHSGEIRVLTNIARPDVAVITKIGTAHMGNLGGTRRDVFNAKMEITEGLKAGGTLVLCGDDDMLAGVAPDGYDVIFAGLNDDGRNMIYAAGIEQFWDNTGYGLRFQIHYDGNSYPCELPVLGRHNAQNALLALAVGVKLGVPIERAIEGLRIYPRSAMRLETAALRGIKFIKDYYNASPDSMEAALDTLAAVNADGARIAVLGEMLELGGGSGEIHRGMAAYSAGKADCVFYVGNHRAAVQEGRADALCYASNAELNDALEAAVIGGKIKSGDIVLIKGSNGMKMWEQFEFLRNLLERGDTVAAQTRLLIDVDALKHNYAAIKQAVGAGVEVMPVIKADAYGGGMDLVANVYSGCKYFAVADTREAIQLRGIMPNADILLLYRQDIRDADIIARHDFLATACDAAFVKALDEAARGQGKNARVHVKIDTGLGRFGVRSGDWAGFADLLAGCAHLTVEGIYTHYSSADMYGAEDLEFTERQTGLFKEAVAIMEGRLGHIAFKHACASAAIFNPKAERFNMVRPGLILYGYYPCEEIKGRVDLRPYLKYVTRVTRVAEYEGGAAIGYGRAFVTGRPSRIAYIPVGYSDGFMRRLSNCGAVVVKGQLAPIVGRVSMDCAAVDVTDIRPGVCVGDEAAMFDNVNMTVERIAELCGTIVYEVLSNIKSKADRIEIF